MQNANTKLSSDFAVLHFDFRILNYRDMRFPFTGLGENLAAFCAELRREHGFRIGPSQLHDAARALLVTRLADEDAVRNALRPVLCSSAEDVANFDAAFEKFFHPTLFPSTLDAFTRSPVRDEDGPVPEGQQTSTAASVDEAADSAEDLTAFQAVVSSVELDDAEGEADAGMLRSSYSPIDSSGAAPHLSNLHGEWRPAATAFLAALRIGLSRRWRPAARGARFDLRRTLRHSLHTGGEAVIPRWQTRPRRRPRVVLLVDGSRSMSEHAQVALDIAIALTSVAPDIETFTFSTTLRRATQDVRRAAAGERRSLDQVDRAWGGGTSLGACVGDFVRRFGPRLLGRETVVIVASDGLDAGDARLVRDAMQSLKRRSAAVIWLNPLLETPGYEPTALGMSAARPYLSTFAAANDPAALMRLSRQVRVRP
jgi:uncharacterized protein with von Willebrand factor type A (vWA) domain